MPQSDPAYLVCATPRSGSTLLCETLAATGVGGRPGEYFEALLPTGLPRQPREYLGGVRDRALFASLPPIRHGDPLPPFADRLAAARAAGTTANGVFAAKVMWGHLPDLLMTIRDAHPRPRTPPVALVDEAFGGVAWVHVSRRDTVAQAVSLWRAIQTDAWRHTDAEDDAAPEYSFPALDHLARQLAGQDADWSAWFNSAGVQPLRLDYEDVVADLAGAVRDVLAHAGVEGAGGVEVPEPPLRRQSDGTSQEWAARYRDERDQRAAA